MSLQLVKFEVALDIVRGKGTVMSWFRKDTPEDDAVYIGAAEVIGETLGDADEVRKIEATTGRNLRDQITVEELQDIEEEARLRRFGWSRN